VVPTHHQAPLSPAAVKASAGATEHLLLVPVDDLPGALASLHVRGVRVVGADEDAPMTARQADLRGPIALVVGSEGQGIGPAVRRRIDLLVRIPMRGSIGSLNAAVAGSVLLFEILEQRGDAPSEPRPTTSRRSADETSESPAELPAAAEGATAEAAAEAAAEAGQPVVQGRKRRSPKAAAPDERDVSSADESGSPATAEPAVKESRARRSTTKPKPALPEPAAPQPRARRAPKSEESQSSEPASEEPRVRLMGAEEAARAFDSPPARTRKRRASTGSASPDASSAAPESHPAKRRRGAPADARTEEDDLLPGGPPPASEGPGLA
jgi:tRNA(Leu) C34 or U34 (ribose-2'-O)-methylase TrmL